MGRGWTKISNNDKSQAGQHESVQWPPVFGHGCTKIRKTGRGQAGQHRSIHWPAVLGHGWTKIRNTGKRPAGRHRSKLWPTNFGPLLDQDKKYWPKVAGLIGIGPILTQYYVLTEYWNKKKISFQSSYVLKWADYAAVQA